jgi:hypothetical protein
MKHLSTAVSLLVTFLPGLLLAQNAPDKPDVPTTRILAIGSVTSPFTAQEKKTLLPKEVKATVELYLHGKIDQWWFRADGKGVVFLLNSSSVAEAGPMLEQLPLGVAKRMTFELIPLGPLYPLRTLLGDGEAASH